MKSRFVSLAVSIQPNGDKMLGLVISLLLFLLFLYVLKMVLSALEIPANIQHVVLLIIGILFLIWMLQRLGMMGNLGF